MVMSMAVTLGDLGDRRFSIPDRSGHLFRHARRHPRRRARRLAPVGVGRHTDQFGEASAERAQRRAADRETDLGDAEVATTQQRHRALDAPRHQVAVRRLAVGEAELAAEVPGRHVRAAGERLDVQRLRVLPVDPVADAAQSREVAPALRRCGSDLSMYGRADIFAVRVYADLHVLQLKAYVIQPDTHKAQLLLSTVDAPVPMYSARCWPVMVFRAAVRAAGRPSNTTRPPSWPAPGPRSMIQSACAITARWCSMMITDFPASTSPSTSPSSCSTSARCRPLVGSAST